MAEDQTSIDAVVRNWAMQLEAIRPDDFRPEAESIDQQIFRHLWQATTMTLQQGRGFSGVLQALEACIWAMESDDEETDLPSAELAELRAEIDRLEAERDELLKERRTLPADDDLPHHLEE